ncbi:MAG: MarR family winged helix-turn-helix transcriptional regulator [Thermoleophilaceae bacterium]
MASKLIETGYGRVPLVGLLNRSGQLMDERLFSELRAAGYPELRPGHACVFGNIEPGGSRLTDIAERAQITKQAVGEVASELERIGYLERIPDTTDKRAKILRLTKRGQEAQDEGYAIIQRVERELAEAYGVELVNALRGALEDYTALGAGHAVGRHAA